MYRHHFESSTTIGAAPEELFRELDDHRRFASHMTQSSMMMAGSSMSFEFDSAQGKAIGSKILMSGKAMGLELRVEEVVTERVEPVRKAWETTGEPRLFVIGRYRMGFDIAPDAVGSRLTVFIDYDDPAPPWRWVGRLLGPAYARWCTKSVAAGPLTTFRSRGRLWVAEGRVNDPA